MIEMELDAFDLQEIAMFAERRNVVKIASNAVSKKYDTKKSEFELHYIGAMGEYAVSKMYKTPIDRNVFIGGDDGTDLIINGYKCEIKTTTCIKSTYNIIIDRMEVFKADILISVQVMSTTKVNIMGCISRAKFAKVHRVKDLGYGDCLCVIPEQLSPIEVLLQEIQQ